MRKNYAGHPDTGMILTEPPPPLPLAEGETPEPIPANVLSRLGIRAQIERLEELHMTTENFTQADHAQQRARLQGAIRAHVQQAGQLTPPAVKALAEVGPALDWAASQITALAHAQQLRRELSEAINRDPFLTPEGRKQEKGWGAEATGAFEEQARTAALGTLAAVERFLDAHAEQVKSASQLRPKTAGEWQEASARDSFVAEDVRAWVERQPGRVEAAFRAAVAAGDRVGAYLLARHGLNTLEPHSRTKERFLDALEEADPRDEKALNGIASLRRRVGEVRAYAGRYMTAQRRRELAQKYGLDGREE